MVGARILGPYRHAQSVPRTVARGECWISPDAHARASRSRSDNGRPASLDRVRISPHPGTDSTTENERQATP